MCSSSIVEVSPSYLRTWTFLVYLAQLVPALNIDLIIYSPLSSGCSFYQILGSYSNPSSTGLFDRESTVLSPPPTFLPRLPLSSSEGSSHAAVHVRSSLCLLRIVMKTLRSKLCNKFSSFKCLHVCNLHNIFAASPRSLSPVSYPRSVLPLASVSFHVFVCCCVWGCFFFFLFFFCVFFFSFLLSLCDL